MTTPVEETLIDDICAELVDIGEDASGIAKGFDPAPPGAPSTAQLPALWVFTGAASDDQTTLGANIVLVPRQFRVQVAVIPTGQGNPTTRETLCRPILGAVRAAYRSHTSLGVEWVQNVRVLGDSGIVVLPEYGGAFIGFEVRLEVSYIERRAAVVD